MNAKNHKALIQFVEYLFSGGLYFWSGYAVFALAWSVLHWNLWWAKLAANIIGWTLNYLMQRYWVFASSGLAKRRTQVTTRYIIITLVDFGLDYLIVAGLKTAGLSPYLGQFVSAGFFTGWNYLWYRFWVFPEKTGPAGASLPRLLAHRPHGSSAFAGRK